MARTVKHIKHGSGTRKVARPAQGAHFNDKFPGKTVAAGGDNVRTSGFPSVNQNKKRGYAA